MTRPESKAGKIASALGLRTRNIKVFVFGETVGDFFLLPSKPFFPIFMRELGASIPELGLLSALRNILGFFLPIYGGFLADAYGRKKVLVSFYFFMFLVPFSYALAPNWRWLIPGMLLGTAIGCLIGPAWEAMESESVSRERRATAFGVFDTLGNLTAIPTPMIGAAIIGVFGLLAGMRFILLLQAAWYLFYWTILFLFTAETKKPKKNRTNRRAKSPTTSGMLGSPLEAVRTGVLRIRSFGKDEGPRRFLVVSCLLAIRGGFWGPFFVVYGMEILGISIAQIALMFLINTSIETALGIPGGRIADRYGRKGVVVFSQICGFGARIAYVLAWRPWVGVVAFSLVALGDLGNPAWRSIRTEVVPQKDRATYFSIVDSLTSLVYLPMPIIAGLLWHIYFPKLPFLLSLGLDALILLFIVRLIPETRRPEKIRPTSGVTS